MRLTSVFILLLLLAAGWTVDHLRLSRQIAQAETARATEQKDTAQAWALAWQAAKQAGDAAETQLYQSEIARQKILKEKNHEIARLTDGRACLDGAAVRLLNSPGLRLPAVPETAGQFVAPDGAFATDGDVGAWVALAEDAYAECRDRRQALIEWWGATLPVAAPLDSRLRGNDGGGRE